jgi:nicotinate-nucleotide adenylyltransferase
MKIGIFGGAFDPIHNGHLIMAQSALEDLNLDKIIFVPSGNHVFKKNILAAKERIKMINSSIGDNEKFELSKIEINKKKSYTIDTLKKFKKIYPKDQLFFLAGSDILNYLKDWKQPEKIKNYAQVVIFNRPGYKYLKKFDILNAIFKNYFSFKISSSEIKEKVRNKKSIKYLVPKKIENFIIKYYK